MKKYFYLKKISMQLEECQDVTILCSILLIDIEPQDRTVQTPLAMQNSVN